MIQPQGASRTQHIRELAEEILADIELGRLSGEAAVLKAMRLARLAGSQETRDWLWYEMMGYDSLSATAKKYMGLTGRWTDQQKNLGYWGPLSAQEATIDSWRLELQGLRIPDVSYSVSSANPHEYVTGLLPRVGAEAVTGAVDKVIAQARQTAAGLIQVRTIRSKVIALIHLFAANIYYEQVFSGFTESIFERYKSEVDTLLAERCGAVLQKMPAVYDRLAEGDQEAVSQALNTIRRMIDAFADTVYPPSDGIPELAGNTIQLGPPHHQNRINAYIQQRVSSSSRLKRFRQQLSNLYDRVSAGVHHDVTPEEARSLLLGAYLLLGEIITLDQQTVTSPDQTVHPHTQVGPQN